MAEPVGIGEDVSHGIAYVATELLAKRSALWVGRGGSTFALLAAAQRVQEVPGGALVGVSLTPTGLRALYDRIGELLGEQQRGQRVVLPDGIRLGEPVSR